MKKIQQIRQVKASLEGALVTIKDKLEKTAKMIEENLNQDSDCDVSFQGWLNETMIMLTQAA